MDYPFTLLFKRFIYLLNGRDIKKGRDRHTHREKQRERTEKEDKEPSSSAS